MSIVEVTGPSVEPVGLTEVKKHLRVSHDDDDEVIAELITAARLTVERFTRRRLISQTVDLRRTGFGSFMRLPIAPVQSVSQITYLDLNGTSQVLATDQYRLVLDLQPAEVHPAAGVVWPSVQTEPDTVTVRLVVGYGDTVESVPADLRVAIKLICMALYENRGDAPAALQGIPQTAVDLMQSHIFWV